MLRAAIVFFIIALVAMFFGANNMAGLSADVGRTLLWVFVALAIISLLISLVTGGRRGGVVGLILALTFGFGLSVVQHTNADETAGQKVNDTAHDASTKAKKDWRTAKRNARDATGNHSAAKDVDDSVKNTGDSIKNEAKKAQNHSP